MIIPALSPIPLYNEGLVYDKMTSMHATFVTAIR